jgi:hypothetical protein
MIRTRPLDSSAFASLTDDSSARKRSRRWTRAIGCLAVSCRPRVQSSAGVAAADDHAGSVTEGVLLADEVVDAAALPVVDALDPELPRLEGAVPGGDDQRARDVRAALVGADREQLLAVLREPLERLHLLAQMDLGLVLQALLGAQLDELSCRGSSGARPRRRRASPGRRGDLAAQLLEALDDPHRGVTMAGVVRGRQTRRACSQNRDVDDAVSAQRAKSLDG